MEKNIITSEDEAKSLEDLLDELVQSNINESNDEIINDDETVLPNLIPIVIDKKEYFAPDVDAPYYQFRGYEIILYKQQLNHESEILRVYESESIIFNFTLTLTSLYTSSDCTIKNLYAFLYRVGDSNPLCFIQPEDLIDEAYYDFSKKINHLRSGNYFILISSIMPDESLFDLDVYNNNTRIHFRVLPKGDSLSHPDIKSMIVNTVINKTKANSLITSPQLSLILNCNRSIQNIDELSVHCYHDNLRLMANVLYTGCTKKRQTKIALNLCSEYVWMDGSYFIILAHNGEPFYLYRFKLESNKAISIDNKYIEVNSHEYILNKFLNGHHSYWDSYDNILGVSAVRRMIVSQYDKNIINNIRSRFELPSIDYNFNFIYITVSDINHESILKRFSTILNNSYSFKYIDCASLIEPKNSLDPYEEINNLIGDCNLTTICLSNLSCLLSNGIGRMIIQKIEGKLSSIKTWSLILVGSESEIDQLLQTAPSLSIFFPSENRIVNNHLTAVEVMHHLQTRLRELNFQLSQDIKDCLVHAFEIAYNEGKLNQWNENKVIEFINEAIVKRYQERILKSSYSNNDDIKSLLTNLELSDIDLSYLNANDDSFTESMSELNSMVGLKMIKRNMIDLFNQISFMKNRHELGFRNITNDSYHMIFTGNPGTGKTTVAKMIGRIFHSLGLLSKGDVIVTERSQLVGRYIGETEKNMQSLLLQAKGNVLFIDEAYTLCDNSDDKKDFGNRAIESLLTVLAQKNNDMIVIFAGYEKEMEKMMAINPGLKGRFPYRYKFDDYSVDELITIAQHILDKENYILSEDANVALRKCIIDETKSKDAYFSNARWIEQIIKNGIIPTMANRIVEMKLMDANDKDLFQIIHVNDVEMAYKKYSNGNNSKYNRMNPIGFRL